MLLLIVISGLLMVSAGCFISAEINHPIVNAVFYLSVTVFSLSLFILGISFLRNLIS